MKNYDIDKKAVLRKTLPLVITSIIFAGFTFFLLIMIIRSIVNYMTYTEKAVVIEKTPTGSDNLAEYKYVIDNKTYKCTTDLNRFGGNYIYYNPKNPSDCSLYRESDVTDGISITLFFLGVSVAFIIWAYSNFKKFKILQKRGILIKNVPYVLSPVYSNNNGVRKQIDSVLNFTYIFPNGLEKNFSSERISDLKKKDIDDGKCDFLYDPDNIKNYYIAYEINAIGPSSRVILYEFTDCYRIRNSKNK